MPCGSSALDPSALADAALAEGEAFGYLELHIEQGPVLESEGRSLGVVDAIVGQTRLELTFLGQANHAGTTPMLLRHDAMAAAAAWIVAVEAYARGRNGLVATVGRVESKPGVGNVIAGETLATLDVRHADDAIRRQAELDSACSSGAGCDLPRRTRGKPCDHGAGSGADGRSAVREAC